MKDILFSILTYPLYLLLAFAVLLFQLGWILFNPKSYLDCCTSLIEIINALDDLKDLDSKITMEQLLSYAKWREE